MKPKQIISRTHAQTMNLGKKTGQLLWNLMQNHQMGDGFNIALKGDLGAGKTTFVKGLAQGLNVPPGYYITSPTFNIINEYPAGGATLCHIDLYRLGSVDELEYTGFDDLVAKGNILVIEWPQMLMEENFPFDLILCFDLNKQFYRKISFRTSGQQGTNLIEDLFSK